MVDLGYALNHTSVLVTGAEGYLGKHVLELLKTRNISCMGTGRKTNKYVIGCDLTNRSEVDELLKIVEPEVIVHCAASVPKQEADYSNMNAAEDSLLMAENIAAISNCPLILISSMTVYENLHTKTKLYSEDLTINPTGAYASAKFKAENICSKFCQNGFMVLRMPGLFGPPRQSGLLYNVTKSFLMGKPPILVAPFPLWAALDVRDAAKICVASTRLSNFSNSEIVNVGYDEVFSVGAAISMIADICQVDFLEVIDGGPEFKMKLSLQEKYFYLYSSTFRQRLERFVDEVRRVT